MAEKSRPIGMAAGLGIRMLAGGYDACIVFALCFLAFIPITIAEQSLGTIPQWIKGMLIVTIAYAYFVGFWTRAGTTTGMRPWKLRIAMCDNGSLPSLAAATVRFAGMMLTWLALGMTLVYMAFRDTSHFLFYLAAILPGISVGIMLTNRHKQTLHDLIAGTSIYRVSE